MASSDIRFVHAPDGARLAYSVTGARAHVTIKAGMWLSHLEFDSTNPLNRHWREAMEARGRFVCYDPRGCRLSDWAPPGIDFDARVLDLETVTDAVAEPKLTLLVYSQGAGVAVAYVARHLERVARLVITADLRRREGSSGLLRTACWCRCRTLKRRIATTAKGSNASRTSTGWHMGPPPGTQCPKNSPNACAV